MTAPAIRVERDGDVVWCTLDRPPLNLFEPGLIAAIRRTFTELGGDASLRAAVLTASGRAFSGGMNLNVLGGLDVGGAKALITDLHQALEAVHHAPFPVIAAINGACLGGGFELALACDLRVAVEDARLGLPEVRVGVPSVIEAALLPPIVGLGRAAELLLLGETISAAEARDWGLVNRVVTTVPALREAAGEYAAKLLALSPTAVRLQKELMLRWRQTDLASAIAYGINAFAAAYATGEPREGARAVLEKRPPRFGERR